MFSLIRAAIPIALTLGLAVASANAEAPKTDQKALEAQAALSRAAMDNRHILEFDGREFSGPAWDLLVEEGRNAQFFLIGEEHGISENPKLASAIFAALKPTGYSGMVIETSPFMARKLDAAARDGIAGIRTLFAQPGGEPAFFGMREEAELLADAHETVSSGRPIFWGVDYEVTSDRQLFKQLASKPKPPAAQQAFAAMVAASDASWKKYEETKGPQYIFSFAGDPQLVRDVRNSWPDRDAETSRILRTLEETLETNRAFMTGDNWGSNQRRANLIRQNFLDHWRAAKANNETPKLLVKMGASHLVRGRSFSEAFDLGALLPEIAALESKRAFSIMVLPGKDAQTAVFDPSRFSYRPAPAKDGYARGLEPILSAVNEDAFTLIDLRPLRSVLRKGALRSDANLIRTVMGFDMLLVMSGSTASAELDHD